MNRVKVLLAHINSRGDCLYSTVVARQIKETDYKNCYLTWAISNSCKEVILHNPYVDEIWEIPIKKSVASKEEWADFVKLAEERKKNGEFDVIFYMQIIGDNELNYDGGIRSSTYNNYPRKITVSQQPVIKLSKNEVKNVRQFTEHKQLSKYTNIILLECGPDSFRSNLNPSSALQLAYGITLKHKDTAIILSSNKKIQTSQPAIIDASILTFRENAELTKYCTLFIGCSSGISWLTTTDWAKPLPKIIITDYYSRVCSSMIYDHEFAGIPTNDIIEFQESPYVMNEIYHCINLIISDNFNTAKTKYRKAAKLKNYSFVYRISRESFKRGEFSEAIKAFKRCNKRNGFDFRALLYLLKAYFKLPFYVLQRGLKSTVGFTKKDN